jgi:hypothetical protein
MDKIKSGKRSAEVKKESKHREDTERNNSRMAGWAG